VAPYDNFLLWTGHSSLVDEVMEELPHKFGAIVASVGGGGLILWDIGGHSTAFSLFNTSDNERNGGSGKFSKGVAPKVEEQQFAWPFREPVNTEEVQDYLDVIKEPIDLSTIDKRVRKSEWYKSKKMLYADLMLMADNCKRYNDEAST
jgi:hypothetical protein